MKGNSDRTMKEQESNINLGIGMDTGISGKLKADITEEEKSIAIENGRNIDTKEKNDEIVSAIANFRALSNNG